MRKLVIGMALASSALATPALARDGAWYVELGGGPMIVEDMDFDIAARPATAGGPAVAAGTATVDHEYGYDFSGAIGYDFGMFRLEAEVGYRGADPDVINTTTSIPAAGPLPFAVGRGSYDYVAGDSTALSGMINALLDFGPDDGLQGFIGGGAGIARVSIDSSINRNGPGFLDDSDTGFAWQALAGIRAPLTETIDVGIKYRFFNVDDINILDTGGRNVEARWRSHSLLGTFTFNFGGAPAPVEEVYTPPPPPPPPPPPVVEPVPEPAPPPRPAERG